MHQSDNQVEQLQGWFLKGLRERTEDNQLHQPGTSRICHLHRCLKPQEADAKLTCWFCQWLCCVVATNGFCVSVLLVTMHKQTGKKSTTLKSCLLNMYYMALNFFRLSSMITIRWLEFLFSFLFGEFSFPKSNLVSFELGFLHFCRAVQHEEGKCMRIHMHSP